MTRFLKATKGAIAVELAVVAPFLALLIVGAWDMGRYLNESAALTNLSRTGVQYSLSKYWDPTLVRNAVQAEASRQSVPNISITVTATCVCSDGTVPANCSTSTVCSNGGSVKVYSSVKTSRTYTSTVPIPPEWGGTFTMQRTANVRVR